VMSIDYIVSMVEKRLAMLEQARRNSEAVGDIEGVVRVDEEIVEAKATLAALRGLS
jgi:hypothetical protein